MLKRQTRRQTTWGAAPRPLPQRLSFEHDDFGPNLVGALGALPLAVRVGCPLAGELHVRWQGRSPLTDAAQERLIYIDALRCAARRRGRLSPFLRSARWRNLLGNTCAWLVWDALGLGTSEERVQIEATPDIADRLHIVLSLARCEPDGITAFVLPCRGCGSGHTSAASLLTPEEYQHGCQASFKTRGRRPSELKSTTGI